MPNERLILASASPVRARLLYAAGIDFVVRPSALDEAVIKRQFRAAGRSARDCALSLAKAKAAAVSAQYPQAIVIGADQILICGTIWFDKPNDPAAARRQLRSLCGREHVLETAACAVRGGEGLWAASSAPRLGMRDLSDGFVHDYVDSEGDAILGSVGAYRLEGRGVQLFDRIDGDYFAVLGLPLLPLLRFLREQGHLAG